MSIVINGQLVWHELPTDKKLEVTGGQQVYRPQMVVGEYKKVGRIWASSRSHKTAREYLEGKSREFLQRKEQASG